MSLKSASWIFVPVLGAALVLLILCACAVTGVGYEGGGYGDVGVGYVGGVYEPYGYDYGGWGGRYRVGPPAGGDRGRGDGPRGGRGAPSIPRGARGGVGHGGGGGHSGGGGHGH